MTKEAIHTYFYKPIGDFHHAEATHSEQCSGSDSDEFLGVLVTGVKAQSGNLEPPGSAVDGSGDPVATTQTQPSWDQKILGAERFRYVLGGPAVLDNETGLVWEAFLPGNPVPVSWDSARRSCLNSTTAGRGGWRLPSVHELKSLVDPTNPGGNPDLPPGAGLFGVVQSSVYWSATSDVAVPSGAWVVDFFSGGVVAFDKTSSGSFSFVWCVRGGGPLSEY